MKIDDMRLGDFLYLLDCMQEECCCYKTCNGCRYNKICECDMSSIDSASIERTVEGYAEANGLIDHMHYINDQKWIPVSERLPDKDGIYLVQFKSGSLYTCRYCEGWNCNRDHITGNVNRCLELFTVVAWMPLPEPYTPYKGEHNEKH